MLTRWSLEKLERDFPHLKVVVRRLRSASRKRVTLKRISQKIIRVMRLTQHSVGSISVRVRACINLPTDRKTHRCDPFVVFEILDRKGHLSKFHPKKTTFVDFNTFNPEFPEVFVFEFKELSYLDAWLRITIKDYNATMVRNS